MIVKYEVKFIYDEYNEKTESGIIFAENSELIDKLEEYYGKDQIISVRFYWPEDCDLSLITFKNLDEIRNDW